ncbi:MAG: hypothetical protein ACRDLS_07110 [Solirubrobacteraceae bacterium]
MEADSGGPLLSSVLRGLVIAGLVVAHLAAVAVGLIVVAWSSTPIGAVVGLGVLFMAACAVAWVIGVEHWAAGIAGALQLASAVAVGGCYVAVVGYGVAAGIDSLASRRAYATPAIETAPAFVLALLALLAVGLLVAALPFAARRRRLAVGALVGTVAGAVGLAATTAAAAVVDPCDTFRFDRDRWRADVRDYDGERLGDAIARCDTLDGASHAQVRRMLGAPDRSGPFTWQYFVGQNNSDTQTMIVRFGRDSRVRAVEPP